ncbi:putative transposable element [Pseudoloma neurophilia]|uniref:Putative transposable element n=1 Tax=Pseudoloma neurophilia TaxID=146866 RepID=A0A0R0LXQ6_9MICR|nr:putative transposable element [Pseudoloma neurophilia]
MYHKMTKANYFSKFDLRKGYYQIAIDEKNIEKTAFITPWGKYAYKRIPLGLLNPPKYFHNVIMRILDGIDNIAVFHDEILIFTNTIKEHENILNEILNRFEKKHNN